MADNIELRIADLVSVTVRLTALIERETELLSGHKPAEIAAFADEKARLAATYAREMLELKRAAKHVAAAPKSILDQLKSTTAKLRAALDAHARLVLRLRRIGEGLIRAIAEEVAAKRTPQFGYDAKAGYAGKSKPASAIALNSVA